MSERSVSFKKVMRRSERTLRKGLEMGEKKGKGSRAAQFVKLAG